MTKSQKRRQLEKQRTPAWANQNIMKWVYIRCKRLGPDYHVDHIVPLNSPYVCGLHCEDNLRIIKAVLNQQKSNLTWDQQFYEQQVFDLPEFLLSGQYELPL